MTKTNYENVTKRSTGGRILSDILEILICLILFITAIYKGGFYKGDFLFPNAVILIIGVVYLIYKMYEEIRTKKENKRPSALKISLDLFVLLLPLTYFLPILFGKEVSVSDSIYEGLRYVDLSIIYFIVRKSNNMTKFTKLFIILAVLQSILGIDQLTTRSFEKYLEGISTGYLSDTDRLSATLQYANVTGLVISLGAIFAFGNIQKYWERLKEDKKVEMKDGIWLCVNIFVSVLAIVANVFTQSRVSILLMLAGMIFLTVYSYFDKKRELGTTYISIIVLGLFASSICELFMNNGIYVYIYPVIIVISAIILAFTFLITKTIGRIEKFDKTKTISAIFVIILIIITSISMPSKLHISADKRSEQAIRYFYEYNEGENDLYIKLTPLKEDTRYNIKIIEMKNNYSEICVKEFNYYDKTSAIYKDKIVASSDTAKIRMEINVTKGSLNVDKVSLNGENQKMSYMFMPDESMFKLIDTFHKVYGDVLRGEYVKDSFKIFKQSPIIGFGGESFKHKYGEVQTISYISTEAHSFILQSLTEVGIVGTIVYLSILLVSITIVTKLMKKNINIHLCVAFALFVISAMVDLVFSYALGIYLFGLLLAMVLNSYMGIYDENYTSNNKWYEKLENKVLKIIDWGYVRVITLSLTVVVLSVSTCFGINAYKASLVKIPNKSNDLTAAEIEENIVYLELKIEQDKYDISYRKLLNEQYINYIDILKSSYIDGGYSQSDRDTIKEITNNITKNLKENADNMIDYEYYDKYVLKDVADIYMNNFVSFTKLYEKQFKDQETAYAFYLGYVIKLTDRILEINPLGIKANQMVKEMYTEYVTILDTQNNYLGSSCVEKMKNIMQERIKE